MNRFFLMLKNPDFTGVEPEKLMCYSVQKERRINVEDG